MLIADRQEGSLTWRGPQAPARKKGCARRHRALVDNKKTPVYPVHFLVKIELSIVFRDHRSHTKQQNFNFFPLPQGQGPYLSYPLYIFLIALPPKYALNKA